MKRFPKTRRKTQLNSFTLVELLVVIGIIAILVAVVLSAGTSALRAALRAKAMNTATQIQTASLGYYTEYSIYPTVGGPTTDFVITDATGSAATWGQLIQSLCGNVHPSTGAAITPAGITNSRGIAFLTMKASDVDSSDAPLNPLPAKTTNPYFNIAIDSDYDGVIGLVAPATILPKFSASPFNAAAAAGGGTSTAGVAVWANCNTQTSITNAGFYVHTY